MYFFSKLKIACALLRKQNGKPTDLYKQNYCLKLTTSLQIYFAKYLEMLPYKC